MKRKSWIDSSDFRAQIRFWESVRQSTCAIEVLLKLEVVSIAAAENGFPIASSCAQGARGLKF
jgi:hypothetical protein